MTISISWTNAKTKGYAIHKMYSKITLIQVPKLTILSQFSKQLKKINISRRKHDFSMK